MHPVSRSQALSRSNFHAQLREWYDAAFDGDTVGDPSAYAGRPWVWIAAGGTRYCLHANTTHEAVGDYLDLLDAYGDNLAWTVAPNERGAAAKVAFGGERRVIPGFHLYRPAPEV